MWAMPHWSTTMSTGLSSPGTETSRCAAEDGVWAAVGNATVNAAPSASNTIRLIRNPPVLNEDAPRSATRTDEIAIKLEHNRSTHPFLPRGEKGHDFCALPSA